MASARTRKIVVLGLLNLGNLIPAVILIMLGQPGLSLALVFGSAVGITGLMFSARLGVGLALAAGASAAVLSLLHPYPLAGGVVFGLLTGAAAYTSRRGLHSAAMMVPLFTSFILIAPISVPGSSSTLVAALLSGAAFTAGGLWVVVLAKLLLGEHLPSATPRPVHPTTSIIYAVISGLIVGIAAGILLWVFPRQPGAWLLLTLLILLQPDPHDSWRKTIQRLGGTIAGGLVSLIFVIVPLPSAVTLSLGVVLLFAAFVVRFALHRPYWQYVIPLTVAAVLLDSTEADRADIALDRVAFTLIGGIATIGVALAVKAVIDYRDRAASTDTA